jgi:hypothetical protein
MCITPKSETGGGGKSENMVARATSASADLRDPGNGPVMPAPLPVLWIVISASGWVFWYSDTHKVAR